MGGFKGGQAPTPNLAPNEFRQRPFGASRIQENLLAAGLPQTPVAGEQEDGFPVPKNPERRALQPDLQNSEQKCADTIGTVPAPWAGHFQC